MGIQPLTPPQAQQTQQVVTIQQDAGLRFLDAHEISQQDFNVVTRQFQNNNTQRWALTDMGGGLHTIQQVSSGRFLEAYLTADRDFQAVTRRERPGDNLQLWRLGG